MEKDFLDGLLRDVAAGKLTPEQGREKLRIHNYEALSFAKIDYQRALRTGFPEVVWGRDKTPEQIAHLLERLAQRNAVAMATRVSPDAYDAIRAALPRVEYYEQARICALRHPAYEQPKYPGRIGIVTAGTADIPVAEEAAVTASLCGFETICLWDVGVAGIHRLLDNLPLLDGADVLIVAAGMEGALASVVGGLAAVPVIAVPTSVGYGASFGGVAALLAMLNSCATGVGVVNIDNGFGAAMLAAQMLRVAGRLT
jgi:hypothetical protein